MAERSLAQRYVGEGHRHDAHPLIQFLDGPSGRRASRAGRGLDVWEVIATIRDNSGSIGRAPDCLQVPAGLVEAAVAYYGEYQAEIDQGDCVQRSRVRARDCRRRGRRASAARVKALLDEQLSPQIAALLRQAGHDVEAVADRADLAGPSDMLIFEVACARTGP
jgi:Domain of unknown function (DUF5615)